MSQQSFERMQQMAQEIREGLGDVVVAVSDLAVHVDAGAAVHAIVERMGEMERRHNQRVTDLLNSNNALLERARATEAAIAPSSVDWRNASEATAAIRAGQLPPNCRMEGTTLVVRDAASLDRFSLAVRAHFHEIKGEDGTVIKSRAAEQRNA